MNNIYANLTANVNELYEYREKLYANKTILDELPIEYELSKEKTEELNNIKNSVDIGRHIITDQLKKYNDFTSQKNKIMEFDYINKNICMNIQKYMNELEINFHNQGFDTDELKNYTDGILFSIGEISNIINVNKTKKLEDIDNNLRECSSILSYLADTYSILKNTQIGNTCPICLSNNVDTFCEPCGHVYCNECIKPSLICYMCKGRIKKQYKIYFS